jgi:hypothetical protein
MPEWPMTFQFVVAVLGTWRVAHLMAREDGPFDVIVRLRARAGDGAIGALMDCPHCLGIWIAMPFAWWLSGTWGEWVAAWLGISGGASFLQRMVDRGPSESPSSPGMHGR